MAVTQDYSPTRGAEGGRAVLRRLVCALVLVPTIPAASIIGTACCRQWIGSPPLDDVRWFNLLVAALTVTCSVLIWRTVIVWTLGRTMLTGLVGMIPFVQVIYAQPLWNAGCGNNDMLRIGQAELGIGLWVWLAIWVWWGWERIRTHPERRPEIEGRWRMTPTAKRVIASAGTIPFSVGSFIVMLVVWDDLVNVPGRYVGPLACAVAAVVAVTAWLLIWRKGVAWAGTVIGHTVFATTLLLGGPIAATFLVEDLSALGMVLGVSPLIGWGLWMAVTMWIWPMRAPALEAVASGPRCLQCGYLLIGLRATRCPECGSEPTLDELWAATVGSEL